MTDPAEPRREVPHIGAELSSSSSSRCHTPAVDSRRLVLVRHAKAVPAAGTDASRPLTARGIADAAAVGRWLAAAALVPDRVVTSPARRAVQTWEVAAAQLPGSVEPDRDGRVYDNTVDDLLAVIRETPAAVGTLVVVGHNPSVHALTLAVDGDSDDRTMRDTVAEKYPTGGIAVLRIGTEWTEVDVGVGTLTGFAVPRS